MIFRRRLLFLLLFFTDLGSLFSVCGVVMILVLLTRKGFWLVRWVANALNFVPRGPDIIRETMIHDNLWLYKLVIYSVV